MAPAVQVHGHTGDRDDTKRGCGVAKGAYYQQGAHMQRKEVQRGSVAITM